MIRMWIFVEPSVATTSNENAAGTSNESTTGTSNECTILNESADLILMETENSNDNNLNLPENTIETQNDGTSEPENLDSNELFDLGDWIDKTMNAEERSQLLKRCWMPPASYDFKADSSDPKRKFIHSWLQTYAPWLAYSKKLKGPLCLYCILFHPNVVKGVFGAFIVKPFNKYKDMHDACKNHATSQWHRASMKAAQTFTDNIPVDVQMRIGHDKLIEENKKIISSVISNVIFCGRTDSPLRGKDANTGMVFPILIYFFDISC